MGLRGAGGYRRGTGSDSDADGDDDALIAAARAGDRGALEQLLRRHQRRIYTICRRLTGNDADAYDATQQALISISRGLDRFAGRARFTTWAYRIASNAALDEIRRRNRRDEPTDDIDRSAADDSADWTGSAGDVAETVANRIDLEAALTKLPETFRTAVVLRDVAGLDYAEIAATLDLPIGTVRSRIARGRGRLAGALAAGNGNQTGSNNVETLQHDRNIKP